MAEEHISFSELEFDSTENQSHLNSCEMCQRSWAVFRFLGLQVQAAPEMELPAFFAQRVARLAQTKGVPFAFFFQRAARQLIPVFTTLVLVTSFLLYNLIGVESTGENYSVLFFEQPLQEDLSLEYVLDSLREVSEEESIP